MAVGKVVPLPEARRELSYEPWDAKDHVMAVPGTEMPPRFNLFVPLADVKRLRLGSGIGKPPAFKSSQSLDPQAMRGVRRITPESAKILDGVLGSDRPEVAPVTMPVDSFTEGALKRMSNNRYERDPHARAACIDHHGTSCIACGFNFEKVYGSIGADYIHVHHVRQLSECGGSYTVDPISDMVPVCPNCHAMIHRNKASMTVEELQAAMRHASKGP